MKTLLFIFICNFCLAQKQNFSCQNDSSSIEFIESIISKNNIKEDFVLLTKSNGKSLKSILMMKDGCYLVIDYKKKKYKTKGSKIKFDELFNSLNFPLNENFCISKISTTGTIYNYCFCLGADSLHFDTNCYFEDVNNEFTKQLAILLKLLNS